MRKHLLKLTLMGVFIAGCANATEMRSPYLSERGPVRYKFEKGNPDRYSLDVYAIGFGRLAEKAFLSHGTDTKPLTALMFNKADFPLREIFPNSIMPKNAEYYNPFMNVVNISPRASYYEWGATLGARFEYPVYKDIGRIGLRANIPFKTVEIERENALDKEHKPLQDFVLSTPSSVAKGGTVPVTRYNAAVDTYAKLYKFELIQQLFQGSARTNAIVFGTNSVQVINQEIAKNFETANQTFRANIQPNAGLIFNAANTNYPKAPNFLNWQYNAGFPVGPDQGNDVHTLGDGGPGYVNNAGYAISSRSAWAFDAGDPIQLPSASLRAHAIPAAGTKPAMNALVQTPNVAFFNSGVAGTDYSAFDNYLNWTDDLKNAWLAFGYYNGVIKNEGRDIVDFLDSVLPYYDESAENWLYRTGGYQFETSSRTGLGDIDLDLFYEHMFSDRWIGELMLGLRFPTGLSDDYSQNPYKAHLGNGEHWELKFGGLIAWEPLSWMNLKLDLKGAYAFESSEKRCAAFKGATIKNIGPAVDADVDWWYFVGCFDFNFFHPKTKDISADLGYEFYYKGEDDLHFKQSKAVPFYGQDYLGRTDATHDLNADLSNSLAEQHTESISHKVRLEVRIQINKWFEAFGGGAYTFAGQNIPRETDFHGGCNVRF